MEVYVNGQPHQVPEGATVEELLSSLGLLPSRVAVWVDGRQLWQREYGSYRLAPGQQVKVLRPVAGG